MSNENERSAILTRMFDAYGQVPSPSRIDIYLEVVGNLPIASFTEGIRDAMRESTDFPPGPGTVRRCVLASANMRPGDPPLPELPHEAGPRIGAGDSLPALVSGLERRVERNYANVIRRAAEIRVERKLSDTLDARLWSLGQAESETGYREGQYDCRCVDRQGRCRKCGPNFEASIAQQRANAGRRLGVA